MKHPRLRTALGSLSEACGLTALAKRMTRRGFRILCYHGFSLADEHDWSPGMFVSQSFFRRRMEIIAESGMNVVPLSSILDGNYPDNSLAITIDDGWDGTLAVAAPILREFGYPSTLYLSSYYSETQTQVFNVLADYVLWKTAETRVVLPEWSIDCQLEPGSLPGVLEELRQLGHGLHCEERQRLADELAGALRVDTSGLFYFLSLEELKDVSGLGMDLQLHTHRHRFIGLDSAEIAEELESNRRFLDRVETADRRHFCFPSGNYSVEQLLQLEQLGVHTATTCEPGLNFPGRDPLQLLRLLDAQNIPEAWFKAMLSGLPSVVRTPFSAARRLVRAQLGPTSTHRRSETGLG